MIELRAVTAGGFHEASLVVNPGESCRLLLAAETDLALFLGLLAGTARPLRGAVLLFGREISDLPEPEALALLARLGLVWPGGGFISNLKTWENILLPLWYHGDGRAGGREAEVVELLGRIGVATDRVPDFLGALPGTLPAREQRLLGVARAMMQDAEVMIYAELLAGLDEATRTRLLAETERHQARRPGRAALYLSTSAQGLPEAGGRRSLRQEPGGGIVPWP